MESAIASDPFSGERTIFSVISKIGRLALDAKSYLKAGIAKIA
jgi:hypothetical protein